MSRIVGLVAAGLMVGLAAPALAGGTLVPGGAAYAPLPVTAGEATALEVTRPTQPVGSSDAQFIMGFTPRQGIGAAGGGSPTGAVEPRLTLSLSQAGSLEQRLDHLSLGQPQGARARPNDESSLIVGGGLEWDIWSLGGTYTRASLAGVPTDLVGARVGYGDFTARLSFGELEEGARAGSGLWLLSTDLAAWSWLSLEGDVAVQTHEETEPETVGRLGVKLRF